MYLTTQGFVNTSTAITSKLPGFDGYFTEFVKNNTLIKSTKEQLEHLSSGMSENKDHLRITLIKRTLDVSEKIEVFAKVNDNIILANKVHYTESELARSRATSLSDKSLIVLSKATEHAKDLESYGITAAMLTDLKDSVDKYSEAIPTIRISQSNQILDHDNIKDLFKANNNLLKKMDLLAELVKSTNPDFYKSYKSNRKVIYKGSGALSLIAKVTNASDGTAVKGAKVTITSKIDAGTRALTTENTKPIVKKTAAKGGIHIKNMSEGIYSITIEKVGYTTKTITANITDSECSRLELKLEEN